MDENELVVRIKSKMEMINENYDLVKPFIQDYLLRIEGIISEKEKQRENANKAIKESTFSISSLSDALDCSRTTFYNHDQLLKRYIEKSIELFEKNGSEAYCESLTEEIRQLKKQISLMQLRDVQIETMKIEIKNLTIKLKSVNSENEKLTQRLVQLNNENMKLKHK